jgi:hypothetical protein
MNDFELNAAHPAGEIRLLLMAVPAILGYGRRLDL